jgi:hypothetical protein
MDLHARLLKLESENPDNRNIQVIASNLIILIWNDAANPKLDTLLIKGPVWNIVQWAIEGLANERAVDWSKVIQLACNLRTMTVSS